MAADLTSGMGCTDTAYHGVLGTHLLDLHCPLCSTWCAEPIRIRPVESGNLVTPAAWRRASSCAKLAAQIDQNTDQAMIARLPSQMGERPNREVWPRATNRLIN